MNLRRFYPNYRSAATAVFALLWAVARAALQSITIDEGRYLPRLGACLLPGLLVTLFVNAPAGLPINCGRRGAPANPAKW